MKNRWIDRTVILFPFETTLCVTEEQFKHTLKAFGIKNVHEFEYMKTAITNATVHFPTNEKGGHAAIVCIGKVDKLSLISIYGLIVHESVHIFQKFCELIGEEYPSSEFEAYGIQALSQALMFEYDRLTAKCDA